MARVQVQSVAVSLHSTPFNHNSIRLELITNRLFVVCLFVYMYVPGVLESILLARGLPRLNEIEHSELNIRITMKWYLAMKHQHDVLNDCQIIQMCGAVHKQW